MSKTQIKPTGERFLFHVEILLSEAQLRMMCEQEGSDYDDLAIYYKRMWAEKDYGPVTLDPSFDIGLGANVNDYLSLGFLLANFLGSDPQTKVTPGDLWLHPFRHKLPVIHDVKFMNVDCEIETSFERITVALTSSGEEVHINDIAAINNSKTR
jgi:hypothetical protein